MCLQGMVCGLNHENEVVCSIDDGAGNVVSFFFSVSKTVDALFQEVVHRLNCDPDTFELKFKTEQNDVLLNDLKHKSLQDVGLKPQPEKNNFTLRFEKNKCVVKTEADKSSVPIMSPTIDDLGASPPAAGDMTPIPKAPPPPAVVQPTWSDHLGVCGDMSTPAPVPFVGLVNQAMTCYLNSLLQALFMTPEFRNALYRWEFDGSEKDEVTSIPYQLQKLFLNLQTSDRSSVETTALTRSFGWDSSEAWQQHDIQELCREMFDALEKKFKDTDQADLINRLYEGTMTDYVKCLECSTEKSREDKFLDIPLTVRPFGSSVAYSSVEEALRAFVQPETLDGNNQYFCERCGKKCDAHKGLKFKKFPYIVTLHLKRFDFDYSLMNRIKLNDKVTFPKKINLNGFIPKEMGESPSETVEEAVKCDDSSTTDSGSALDEDNAVDTPSTSNHTDYQEDDEGIDISNTQENEKNRFNAADAGETGPYIYELFSIMIHSGSASGGHYYAYIKDFKQGEWFCFNDQSVSRITHDDIERSFGGSRGYYSGVYSPSTNAYMLMYRQIDSSRNAAAMTAEEFPPHIHKLLKRIKEQKERELQIREREQEMIRIKCYLRTADDRLEHFRLVTNRDTTLSETLKIAILEGNLDPSIPAEHCRLVSFDPSKGNKGTIECSFEGRENEEIKRILDSVYKPELLLEVRKPDEQFKIYRIGDITTKVMVINPFTQEVESPIVVRGNKEQTVAEYLEAVGRALKVAPDQLHIYVERYSRDSVLLKDNEKETLHTVGMYDHTRVFAVKGPMSDPLKVDQLIKQAKNIITLQVSLPTVTKKELDELNIEESAISSWTDGEHDGEKDRNVSPQPPADTEELLTGAHSDQSASEDSSLTDSERTLVGDDPEDPDPSPHDSPDQRVVTWEDEETRYVKKELQNKIKKPEADQETLYFKAERYQDGSQSMLRIMVDKQITIKQLKDNLQPYVGVSADYFKIFRVSNGPEAKECYRPTESLKMSKDDDCISVQLGKALRQGESAGKVYLLDLKNPDPDRFLIDWAIPKCAPVNVVKKEILAEVRRKCNIDIPFDRCRLRLKKWTYPSRPYLNDTVIKDINGNWELFIQELEGPEPVTSEDQRLFFVRQWSPSTLTLGPVGEVLTDTNHSSELKEKISAITSIPTEHLQLARGKSTFPCNEMDVYNLHSDLQWINDDHPLDAYPFSINPDEAIIIFKDQRETLKSITNAERKQSSQKRTKSSQWALTQRKERALKIYVDSPPPRKHEENDTD